MKMLEKLLGTAKVLLLALVLFFAPATFAQGNAYQPQLLTYNGPPVNTCDVYQIALDLTNGVFYFCKNRVWTAAVAANANINFTGNDSFSQPITSTVATGTAPLVIASTTNVPNLNASSLNGATFAAPGPIGGTTPGSGAFTSLSASGQFTSTLAIGTAPFSITSTTVVPNLNAQLHGGLSAPASAIIGLTDAQSPTNKTIDISVNTLKTATNTAGHYPRNNGTQYVDATIAGADIPATTSNCSGVQFAQGLNAGHTPTCATPPTFVASGASHAVGYVPDPGSSAGTTRFLREDATWVAPSSGGVSESIVMFYGNNNPLGSITEITSSEKLFVNAHTLIRFTVALNAALNSCSPSPVVAFWDATSASSVTSITVTNGPVFFDSGVLSVALTAGHKFDIKVTTAGGSCLGGGLADTAVNIQ